MNKDLFNNKRTTKSLIVSYSIALIPIFLFGLYKNFIVLLLNSISFGELYHIIILPIIGLGIGLLADYIENKKIIFSFNSLCGIIIAMIMPFNINILLFLITLIPLLISSFIKKTSLNTICLCKVLAIILLVLFNNYGYFNILEAQNEYAYTIFDKIIGNQYGAIFSTSVLFALIGYIILCFNPLYKKEIAPIAFGVYLITSLGFLLLGDYLKIINLIISSLTIFSFIYIAPFSIFSPYDKKSVIIYSILIGLFAAILGYFINNFEGAIISILIINIIFILKEQLFKSTK